MFADLVSAQKNIEGLLYGDTRISTEMRHELTLSLHYIRMAIARDHVENRQGWNWGMKVI